MESKIMLISGTRKGIGRFMVEYYTSRGYTVLGCSREEPDYNFSNYRHYCLDVSDESKVKEMFNDIRRTYHRLDIMINNAGIASMNHSMLTPISTVRRILETNVIGTFLFSREAAKIMKMNQWGRIVNFATFAVPFKLEGEAIYAASKAAVVSLTEVLAREYADFGVTVNAVSPPAIQTDLIRGVPIEKMNVLLSRQAIHRFGQIEEVCNVINFFISPNSDIVTGQVVYLGGL